jgi:hypothetical protein
MLQSRLPVDILDWILWGLEVLALVLALRARGLRPPGETRSLTAERSAIAILLAWSWRLVYVFVLASSGFRYLVPDDVARWLLSWGWSVSPYFVTWDGVWQGGTFFVHGAAMTVLHDPLVASKFVSAFYNLLPLVGIFVLTQGLYRNARLSSLAVVAAAPWWLHILLGTGTMTEMPVTGLMLAGVGLLLLVLDEKTRERNAVGAMIVSALCFAAATSFHLVAWMMLVSFLVAFARPLLTSQNSVVRRRLPLFLGLSFSYCVVWVLACWIKFGNPLSSLTAYSAAFVNIGLRLPPAVRIRAYPLAFLYDAWLILPALGAGVIGAWVKRNETGRRERTVVIGVAATLAVMTGSAIVGNTTTLPARSTVPIVAALFPIALAAVAGAWPIGWAPRQASKTQRLRVVAVLVLAVAWLAVNHARTFQRVRSQQTLEPDAVAMGAWLRETLAQPDSLSRMPPKTVVHVWVATSSAYPDLSIAYLFGSPGEAAMHGSAETGPQVMSQVRRGEFLLTDQSLTPPGFMPVVTIGKYRLFRKPR